MRDNKHLSQMKDNSRGQKRRMRMWRENNRKTSTSKENG